MDDGKFDQRYPAMFQPGGEGATPEHYAPERLLPPSGEPAPPIRHVPGPAAPGEPAQLAADQETGQPGADGPEPSHGHSVREPQWGARAWALGLSAVLATFAAAAFCLVASALIPAARSNDPTELHGIMAVPWGVAILPGAPALLTAGLGMLAALFLAASRHYTARAGWFHGALAAVGLAALAGGAVSVFSEALFSELIYSQDMSQGDYVIQWYMVFQLASGQLLLLGPAILALAAVVRPGRPGAPAVPSARAALAAGAVLAAGGVWTWFAPQFFPLAEGPAITTSDGQVFVGAPWPYMVGQAGGPLLVVGAGALFGGLLILATTRRRHREPDVADLGGEDAGRLDA